MKLGVVSDTHSLEIPKQLLDDFKDIDLIIHAGDFCSADDLAIFSKLAPVEADARALPAPTDMEPLLLNPESGLPKPREPMPPVRSGRPYVPPLGAG